MEIITKFKVAIYQKGKMKLAGILDTEEQAKDMVQNLRVFKNINAIYVPYHTIVRCLV